MTPEQMKSILDTTPNKAMVGPVPGKDRTLLYGYDVDRKTWHVWQQDGMLYWAIYKANKEIIHFQEAAEFPAEAIVPNKRLYPECCDFEFCEKLKRAGAYLSFTNFTDRPVKDFYGETFEDEAPRPRFA